MNAFKWSAALLSAIIFVAPAQAMIVSWDFSWSMNQYSGSGSFSYDATAADDFIVTHGYLPSGFFAPSLDVPDELISFSFTGYENGIPLGTTDVLPSYFAFSPLNPNNGIVWAVEANTDGSMGSTGVGCLVQRCSIFEQGKLVWASTGFVSLRGGLVGALPEPGTLGLAGLGLLLAGIRPRRYAIT